VLTTLVAVYAVRGGSSPAPASLSAPAAASASEQEMVLPHDPLELPPGPHRDTFAVSCTICHSARLVFNQPDFPRKKWAEEVHKMVTAYGAHITPDEEPHIVDYLMAIRGSKE